MKSPGGFRGKNKLLHEHFIKITLESIETVYS